MIQDYSIARLICFNVGMVIGSISYDLLFRKSKAKQSNPDYIVGFMRRSFDDVWMLSWGFWMAVALFKWGW